MKRLYITITFILCSVLLAGCAQQSAPATETVAPVSQTEAAAQPSATQEATEAATQEEPTGDLYFTQQEPVSSPEWVTDLDAAADAQQLIVVAAVGGSTAVITMHQRNAEGEWMQLISTPGFIGKEGLGEGRVGVWQTPVGTFTIDRAFGLAEDPGCGMPYTQVDDTYYWSADSREGMRYNELVSLNELPGLDTTYSERIADYPYAYRYCLNMGYNTEKDPEKGCAFFMHCFRVDRPYTGGCVAVPESVMKQIMRFVQPQCKITIGTMESFGGSLG